MKDDFATYQGRLKMLIDFFKYLFACLMISCPTYIYCKCLNARFECYNIVIFIYSHYPRDLNAKLADTKCFTLGTIKTLEYKVGPNGLLFT